MKKMKQEEKQNESSQGPVQVEISSIVLSSKSFFATADISVFISNISYGITDDPGKPIDRAFFIFHPPSV